MPGQSRSYSRYGSFILLKKLEESTLAEIWRAAPVEGNALGPHIALLRFTGGDTGALKRAAETAAKSLKTIEGSTVVKGQTYHLVGRNPIITWGYDGGRSLFHMLEVARGGPELPSNPFPIDQALAITEKLAISLETTGHLKHGGHRLHHGLLIPQVVWVSEDGDVRTLGHQLTKGMLASLSRAPVQKQFGGFVAPELRRNGESTDPSEVWAVGANLYAMLTGNFLDPPSDQAAMDATLSDAILATDEPIPDTVREVLAKSLAIDPARRFENPAAIREAISSLIHGGEYAPTTFNLAFYIHNLLREEFEAETAERETEKGVDPSLIPVAAGAPADEEPAEAAPPLTSVAGAAAPEPLKKKGNRLPLIAAIVAVLLIGGGAAGYWFTIGPGGKSTEESQIADAATSAANDVAPPEVKQPPVVEPLVAVTDTGEEGAEIETTTDRSQAPTEEELRQKMIQEEIDRRLQEEIMKLQSEYDRKLREERAKQQTRSEPAQTQPAESKPAPVSTPPATPATDKPKTATKQEPAEPPAETTAQTTTATDTAAAPPPTSTAPAEPAATQVPKVQEGDLVEIGDVDTPPKLLKRVEPLYPRLAARQKAEATVFLSALVSENGKVLDVKVLKGDRRKLGFDEAAMEAIRRATFQPAMKEGKRVKTWMPVPVFFKAD